jgi:hypothetical protein
LRALFAVVSAAVLFAAGCGGGGSASNTEETSSTQDSSPAQDWANSLCQAVTSWNNAITSAGASLKDDPTEESLESAAEEIQRATETLSDDLKGLGAPDTESGRQAQESVDELASGLDQGLDQIRSAVDEASGVSGALTAISAISTTLVSMGDQVSSTVQRLAESDAQGELADAFRQAGACSGLAGTTSGS